MAVLSKKNRPSGPSDGHTFDRINDKRWGSHRNRINKMEHVFTNDYIYIYKEDDETDDHMDGELGVNKYYHRYHDQDYCNDTKNEYFALNRFVENAVGEDEEAILDIIEDGLMDISHLLGEDE